MEYAVHHGKWEKFEADLLLIPVTESEGGEARGPARFPRQFSELLDRLRQSREWKGKGSEFVMLHGVEGAAAQRIVLLGIGTGCSEPDRVRRTVMRILRQCRSARLARVGIALEGVKSGEELAAQILQGIVLGCHDSSPYKTAEAEVPSVDQAVFLGLGNPTAPIEVKLDRSRILAEAVNQARRLTNEPGNLLGPPEFAEEASRIARDSGCRIQVLDEREIGDLRMGALLAVASGSSRPPRFVVIETPGVGESVEKPLCLVGKGVTFDSGGISLKPSLSMEEMKGDKAGACSVLATLAALAQLKADRPVVGILPMVENLPGGRAQRPGDVVRSLSGKTIEVINTDAEGRLILADAITYAKNQFSPSAIVDLATLTGACIVALGHERAGYFGNDENLAVELEQASIRGGEKLWRLPLDDEYGEELRSFIADIKNIGSRWGGAVTAAKFLQEFVGDTSWCHIDMAGLDLFDPSKDCPGPRGFGVLTLSELALG
jgi:leucyl aminopeptidase